MTPEKGKPESDWLCECGKRPFDDGLDKWRWDGRDWQHFHGYPVGHVVAKHRPMEETEVANTARDKFEKLGKVVTANLALSKKLLMAGFSCIILGCVFMLLHFFFGFPKIIIRIFFTLAWLPIGYNVYSLYGNRKLLKERNKLLGEMLKFENPWIIKDPKYYKDNQ